MRKFIFILFFSYVLFSQGIYQYPSSCSSCRLTDLYGVSHTVPDTNQVLMWSGLEWSPVSIYDTLGNFIPYYGADTSINFNNQNVLGINSLLFNYMPIVPTRLPGLIYWDSTFKALTVAMHGDDVNLQIGLEELDYVLNKTGDTIQNAKAVYVVGTENGVRKIALAQADSFSTSWVLGITTEVIPPDSMGYVCTRGYVNGVNTFLWTDNTELYLSASSPGELTNIIPSEPNIKIQIGRVLIGNSLINGRINLRIRAFSRVEDLADTRVTLPVVDDVLKYNGLSWVNGLGAVVSGSSGIIFYMDDSTLFPIDSSNSIKIEYLSKVPVIRSEQVETISVADDTLPVIGEAYLYPVMSTRSSIPAGNWSFQTYAAVSSTDGGRISTIVRCVYIAIQDTGVISTLTIIGSGNTRTAVVSGTTPFVPSDSSTDKSECGYVQTPRGLYPIVGYTSSSEVTIEVPETYTNELNVSYTRWQHIVCTETNPITNIIPSYGLYQTEVVEPAFVPVLPAVGYYIAEIIFAKSNDTTDVVFVHNGNNYYSNFKAPLVTLHNDLPGLEGGGGGHYFHLDSLSYDQLGEFADSSNKAAIAWESYNAINADTASYYNLDTLRIYPDTFVTNAIRDSLGAYSDTSITDAIRDSLGVYLDTNTIIYDSSTIVGWFPNYVDSSLYADTAIFSDTTIASARATVADSAIVAADAYTATIADSAVASGRSTVADSAGFSDTTIASARATTADSALHAIISDTALVAKAATFNVRDSINFNFTNTNSPSGWYKNNTVNIKVYTKVDSSIYSDTTIFARNVYRHKVILHSNIGSAASSNFQDVTGLSFNVVLGDTVRFEAYIIYSASATTIGSRWAINGPAFSLMSYSSSWTNTTSSVTSSNQNSYDAGSASNSSATTTGNIARIFGIIIPSSSGTVIIRFAPETATLNGITVNAGSSLEYW